MQELTYNPLTLYAAEKYEEEPRATASDLREFKKQYDAMTRKQKAKMPNWLREYIERDIRPA